MTEPYYPFHSSEVEEFTIGSERCEGGGRAYCNGPLKPGTKYFVKLRAFTAPDKFTDTNYAVLHTGNVPAPPRTGSLTSTSPPPPALTSDLDIMSVDLEHKSSSVIPGLIPKHFNNTWNVT